MIARSLAEDKRRLDLECIANVFYQVTPMLNAAELTMPIISCTKTSSDDANLAGTWRQASIHSLMTCGPLSNIGAGVLGDYEAMFIHLTMFVEQQRMRLTVDPWLRPRLRQSQTSGAPTAVAGLAVLTGAESAGDNISGLPLLAGGHADGISATLDGDVNFFYGRYRESSRAVRLTKDFSKTFQLTMLLSFIPLRLLHDAVGLRDGDAETAATTPRLSPAVAAAAQICKQMAADPAKARKWLIYANELYLRYRAYERITRSEVFYLLAGALYLFAWARFAPENLEAQAKRGGDVVAIMPSSPARLLRSSVQASVPVMQIDKLDVAGAQKWTLEGAVYRARVADLGILCGKEGGWRILEDVVELLSQKGLGCKLGQLVAKRCAEFVAEERASFAR